MKPLFKDNALQQSFDSNGYVIVPMLSEDGLRYLLDLYSSHIGDAELTDLYESSRNKSFATNQLISEGIAREMTGAAGELFVSSRFYGGTFMVKAHQRSSMLALHQDWSVVEEDRFSTAFIWCPLQDVSPVNGGLFVLESSHRYFDSLRSGTYPSNRYYLPASLHRFTKDIYLKAGEAILYSDKLFHGSYANGSEQDRIVVTARVMEEGARLVYYQKKNEQEADVYGVDSKFYLTHIDSIAKGQMPAGIARLYTRPYRHTAVTDDALQKKIYEQHHHKPSTMHGSLFKDPALQTAFDRDGYVVLDLIDGNQVDMLRNFYTGLQHAPLPGHGFQVSLDNERPAFVRTVSEKLIDTVRTGVERYFQDYQIFTASFVVKATNPMGVVPPHQDWSFVDEQQYWSATLWCPLVDVAMENGGLGVIRGSHLFYDHVRPSPSPQYEPPFKDQLDAVFPYLNIIDLKAGQALVFNNRTIHGSPPNASGQTRISFGIGITHKNAALKHFYKLPQQELVEGYDVLPDFFYEYNNARLSAMYERGEKPHGLHSTGVFGNKARQYTTTELTNMMEAAGNTRDELLVQKIASVPGYGSGMAAPGKASGSQNQSRRAQEKRPFWKVYTPLNIYREIRHRLSSR